MQKRLICASTLAIIALSSSPSWAGDLDPPGSPASTPGPEPRTAINQDNTPGNDTAFFRITRPGSYYLTGNIRNLQPFSARNGIVVEAGNVTIDLNGFTLDGLDFLIGPLGPQGPFPPTTGILASGTVENITIRDGIVRDWRNNGIGLLTATGVRVEGVTASNNGGYGIGVGLDGVIARCVANANGAVGIQTFSNCTLLGCSTGGNGSDGINVFQACVVSSCTSERNGSAGIEAGVGSLVSDCVAHDNGELGIAGPGNTVISNCVASGNTGDGIVVGTQGLVLNCLSSSNTEAGIMISGGFARIDGNVVNSNSRGIETALSGNLIVRNRATGSSQDHYGSIAIGNDVGTIQSSPVGAGPWDNFAP